MLLIINKLSPEEKELFAGILMHWFDTFGDEDFIEDDDEEKAKRIAKELFAKGDRIIKKLRKGRPLNEDEHNFAMFHYGQHADDPEVMDEEDRALYCKIFNVKEVK